MIVGPIATDQRPDADAIAASRLAEAYLFGGEYREVISIPRRRPEMPAWAFDRGAGTGYNPEPGPL
jgi:hypothetical protein